MSKYVKPFPIVNISLGFLPVFSSLLPVIACSGLPLCLSLLTSSGVCRQLQHALSHVGPCPQCACSPLVCAPAR